MAQALGGVLPNIVKGKKETFTDVLIAPPKIIGGVYLGETFEALKSGAFQGLLNWASIIGSQSIEELLGFYRCFMFQEYDKSTESEETIYVTVEAGPAVGDNEHRQTIEHMNLLKSIQANTVDDIPIVGE